MEEESDFGAKKTVEYIPSYNDLVISVKDMSKSFFIEDPAKEGRFHRKKKSEFNVFHDVNLEVRKGEAVGIIGKNGAGKSTFLKLVSGILEPDTGEVTVTGKVASILELSMGFHQDLTGRENIVIRSELYGIRRGDIAASIDKIVKYADLGVFIDNPVRTYSSGMKSRLAFSVMINVDADIYVIDEALSTGDAAFSSKSSEHLKNLVREGKTVLFTSHNTGAVESACDRAVWLEGGTVKMDGPAEEVCMAYKHSITESFEVTKSLAEDGASGAMYRLATFYRDGIGCEPDRALYIEWLRKAAEKEHTAAMAEYADHLASEGEKERACELYRQAVESGSFDSRRKYSQLISQERSGITELRSVLIELAQSGFHFDECNCGMGFLRTAVTEKDYSDAAEWFTKAIGHGSIEAVYQLATLCREGHGVPRDIDRCIELLEEASRRGHSRAAYDLARLYDAGTFVVRDKEKAFSWYLSGADAGNSASMFEAARRYEEGIGTDADPEAATEMYARFAESSVSQYFGNAAESLRKRGGDRALIDRLENLSADGGNSRSASKRKKALDQATYFSRCQKYSGMPGAPRARLAECYLNGIGTPKDPAHAFALFKDAADGLDADSMYQVGIMYKDGIGTEASVPSYQYYIRMAADRGNRDASDIVTKWDRRNAKRKKGHSDTEKTETE